MPTKTLEIEQTLEVGQILMSIYDGPWHFREGIGHIRPGDKFKVISVNVAHNLTKTRTYDIALVDYPKLTNSVPIVAIWQHLVLVIDETPAGCICTAAQLVANGCSCGYVSRYEEPSLFS